MKTTSHVSRFLAISTLALGITLAAPLTAFAAPANQAERGDYHHGMPAHHRPGMPDLSGIDLSAAQVAQLGKLREEEKKLMREQGLALRDQHDALRKLVMSEAYTPAAAAEIIAKITAAQGEMAKRHAEQGHQLFQLLTPEQRTKLQQNELTGRHSMGNGHRR